MKSSFKLLVIIRRLFPAWAPLIFHSALTAQPQKLTGHVYEFNTTVAKGLPIPGVNVTWISSGLSSITDSGGYFSIDLPDSLPANLVLSFVGYKNDTLAVRDAAAVEVFLQPAIELTEVQVSAGREGLGYSTIQTINSEKITERELLKAACCNLSEAFETSPTVTVAYTDAVTGAKEIQLLGLSGIYSQLLTEGVPNYRGIAGSYGLYFIPGPWMQSIQVMKGTGSVQQGYEPTTGQINVEFKKPYDEDVPRYYINLFGEQNGNMEANFHAKKTLNDKWSSILHLHGNYMEGMQDQQDDGFLDIPHARQLNLYNRWHYNSGRKLESQFGLRLVHDERDGGQYEKDGGHSHDELYTTKVINRRAELFGKLGIVYPEKPFKSIGNIAQLTIHDLDSRFGRNTYVANQKTLFLQSLYQNTFRQTNHQYKLGLNYRYDEWEEDYNNGPRKIIESVPGAFIEYTYNYLDELSVVTGLRGDYHNRYDFIFTPRFHAKYNFTPDFLVRVAAGRSFRVPNIYSDNISIMASSRELIVEQSIRPERAWNYGLNLTRRFKWLGRDGSVNADFYRTDFTDQLIVDRITDVRQIRFYNLDGKSFSNSFQVTLSHFVLERLEVRLAYKYDDVRTTYNGVLQRKPLVPRDRAIVHLGYETENEHWKFAYTLVREGQKRLAATYDDVEFGPSPDFSPVFWVMNLQATKVFRKFEVYAGSENLLNYIQEHPIVNAQDPFSDSFDAANIWGPLDGRRIYAGIRMSIE